MAVDERVGARTAELQAERERLVARGIATTPIFVERAHGARLTDVEGREYIDFVGGIGVLNGGHTPEASSRRSRSRRTSTSTSATRSRSTSRSSRSAGG